MISHLMHRGPIHRALVPTFGLTLAIEAAAQDARVDWDGMCQIRCEKFDYILPEAMRNGIDMWVVGRENGGSSDGRYQSGTR